MKSVVNGQGMLLDMKTWLIRQKETIRGGNGDDKDESEKETNSNSGCPK